MRYEFDFGALSFDWCLKLPFILAPSICILVSISEHIYFYMCFTELSSPSLPTNLKISFKRLLPKKKTTTNYCTVSDYKNKSKRVQ